MVVLVKDSGGVQDCALGTCDNGEDCFFGMGGGFWPMEDVLLGFWAIASHGRSPGLIQTKTKVKDKTIWDSKKDKSTAYYIKIHRRIHK